MKDEPLCWEVNLRMEEWIYNERQLLKTDTAWFWCSTGIQTSSILEELRASVMYAKEHRQTEKTLIQIESGGRRILGDDSE